jgi:hypothetical protein
MMGGVTVLRIKIGDLEIEVSTTELEDEDVKKWVDRFVEKFLSH